MLGEFGRLLRAIASGPDPASIPSPSEIIPVIELGKPSADWLYPRGTTSWTGYAIEANAAGVRAQVCLYNPTGSGVVAVVDTIRWETTSHSVLYTICKAADVALFDDDGNEHCTDTRERIGTAVNNRPACAVLSDQASQKGDTAVRVFATHSDATYWSAVDTHEYVLFPGSALNVMPTADNIANTTSFWWRERRYDREEVAGTRNGQF